MEPKPKTKFKPAPVRIGRPPQMCLVKVVPDQSLGIIIKGEQVKKTEVDAVVSKIKAEGYAIESGGVTKHIMPNSIKVITVKEL